MRKEAENTFYGFIVSTIFNLELSNTVWNIYTENITNITFLDEPNIPIALVQSLGNDWDFTNNWKKS